MTETGERTGRWSASEHALFLEGLKLHGRLWRKIASMIKTRSIVQIRTHAQKYFLKQQNGLKDHNDHHNHHNHHLSSYSGRSRSSNLRIMQMNQYHHGHNNNNNSNSSSSHHHHNHHHNSNNDGYGLSGLKRHRNDNELLDFVANHSHNSSSALFDSGLDLPDIHDNEDDDNTDNETDSNANNSHDDNMNHDFVRHKPLKIKRVSTPEQEEKRILMLDSTNSPTSVGLTPYLDMGMVLGDGDDKEDVNNLLEEIGGGNMHSCIESETDYSKAFNVDVVENEDNTSPFEIDEEQFTGDKLINQEDRDLFSVFDDVN